MALSDFGAGGVAEQGNKLRGFVNRKRVVVCSQNGHDLHDSTMSVIEVCPVAKKLNICCIHLAFRGTFETPVRSASLRKETV